jgi:hypothetical protein
MFGTRSITASLSPVLVGLLCISACALLRSDNADRSPSGVSSKGPCAPYAELTPSKATGAARERVAALEAVGGSTHDLVAHWECTGGVLVPLHEDTHVKLVVRSNGSPLCRVDRCDPSVAVCTTGLSRQVSLTLTTNLGTLDRSVPAMLSATDDGQLRIDAVTPGIEDPALRRAFGLGELGGLQENLAVRFVAGQATLQVHYQHAEETRGNDGDKRPTGRGTGGCTLQSEPRFTP